MLTKDFRSDLPCVVIHAYTFLTDYEQVFWRRVRTRLVEQGLELLVISNVATHDLGDLEFSALSFHNLLDKYSDMSAPEGGYGWLLTHDLLERERVWCGPGDDKKRARALAFAGAAYDSLLFEMNPALLVVGNGEHTVELILRRMAELHRCRVAFLERGPFPFSFHFDLHGITAGTEAAAREACFWGNASKHDWSNRFRQYEEYYRRNRATWWQQPERDVELRSYFEIPREKKVILFANQLDNDTSNFLNAPLHDTNLEAFRWLCDQLRPHRDEIFVVGKQHPKNRGPARPFEEAVAELGVWTADIPLAVGLRGADRVAAVNSTVLYEALVMRLPVLMLGRAILSRKEVAYEITTLDTRHVEAVIRSWIAAEGFEDRISRWRELGACLLSDCLYFAKEEIEHLGAQGAFEFADRLGGQADRQRIPRRAQPVSYMTLMDCDRQMSKLQKVNETLRTELARSGHDPGAELT